MFRSRFTAYLMLVVCAAFLANVGQAFELTGVILNKHKVLKSFLKDGEAEEYEGISIVWKAGKKATLTIYRDGAEQETVQLYDLKTKEEMHSMFQAKGFHKKDPSVLLQDKRQREAERELLHEQRLQPAYGSMFKVYGVLFAATLVFVGVTRARKKKARQGATSGLPVVRV
eukprot:Nitzschia sp. Nitz4//scaffold27_size158506//39978//40595//NITZ4_002590-RA/size158506-snap-gene-0.198-mRNA-1//1//CDS//3329545458//5857//frame0